jgi:predicted mannosyl-3-phosphoglycerate phosphatase (HAD superfamily)
LLCCFFSIGCDLASKIGSIQSTMFVIVADLDGTLLDHDTYSFEAAEPAVD